MSVSEAPGRTVIGIHQSELHAAQPVTIDVCPR